MKVHMTITLDVNEDHWVRTCAVALDEVPFDVARYVVARAIDGAPADIDVHTFSGREVINAS